MPTLSPRPALPVSLYLSGKRVVLVGNGPLADERENRLRSSNADLVRVRTEDWSGDVADDAYLVMAMTESHETNAAIANSARDAGCLVYAHDQPDVSDLAMPALAARGPLKLAVSTDGGAPALARRMREILSDLLDGAGPDLDALIVELVSERAALPPGQRARLYEIARRLELTGSLRVRSDD